jgi:carboxypeptidase-like protein
MPLDISCPPSQDRLEYLAWMRAQQRDGVIGLVIDAESGKPVESVNIIVLETKKWVTTDDKGRFHVDVTDRDSITIRVQGLGYYYPRRRILPRRAPAETTVFRVVRHSGQVRF